MKGITEMTEQEILALTEEDVQKLIKLRMMEEGIKIMDKPKIPELFEIEPADIRLTYKFATDYYPLSDHNEDMAMKFMAKAYSFTDEEKEYILQNYKELLSTSDE